MIEKNFNELTKGEREILKEVRTIIVNSFEAITSYNNIDLTSDKEDEFPLSEKDLKEIAYSIPVSSYWEDPEKYIKSALKPLKQEAWHIGKLEEVWYIWELHYLPLEKMFKMFKEHHKKTQKELFGK